MKFSSRKFFKRHPVMSLTGTILLMTIALLLLAEFALRIAGVLPGILINDSRITLVDSLYLLNEFSTDETGIMKVSQERIQLVQQLSSPDINVPAYAEKHPDGFGDYVGNLLLEYYSERNSASAFSGFVSTLKNKPEEKLSPVEKAVVDYSYAPVNSAGFRSIEFKNYPADKVKILLLGDSFAWGMSARPITNSFADILLTKGYICYNTGIPAADLPQYLAVAKKYIPQLQPDFVVINFFIGNDHVVYKREVSAEKPVYYDTNAGLLFSNPFGCFLKMDEAYKLFIAGISIPFQEDVLVNFLCAKTSLTTLLWKAFNKKNWHEQLAIQSGSECNATRHDPPISEQYTDEIQRICDEHQAKMMVVLIPQRNENSREATGHETFKNLADRNFTHTRYFYPVELTDSDFHDDGHFNNPGSEKYAGYLDYLIDSLTAD